MEFGFGSGTLWGIRTDVANATPRRFGVLQDVSIDFNGEIKDLFGQFQFPVDSARGKIKIDGKSKMGQISGLVFNDLYFGNTSTTGQVDTVIAEGHTIPATTPFTIAVSNTAGFGDLGPRYHATGLPFQNVGTGTPTVGQYSASAGVYTFGSADSAALVDVDYEYSQTIGGVLIPLTNNLMGYAPRFKAIVSQNYGGKIWTLTLNSCMSPKLNLPTKIDDYVIAEFDFSAYADSSNNVGQLSIGDLA